MRSEVIKDDRGVEIGRIDIHSVRFAGHSATDYRGVAFTSSGVFSTAWISNRNEAERFVKDKA